MKAEKGNRKLSVTRATALYMLAGLIVTLLASGYFKIDTATCVQAYLIFTAGLAGKDVAFVWGNSKEHEHAAKAEGTGTPST